MGATVRLGNYISFLFFGNDGDDHEEDNENATNFKHTPAVPARVR